MTVAANPTPNTAHGTQHIVLLGAGHAHLQVLTQLAAQPLAGTVVTLVAPHSDQMVTGMVAGFMVGRYAPDDLTIALQLLVQRGGIRWITKNVTSLDAAMQTLQLDDGSSLRYDWLSVNTSPSQDRTRIEMAIPGAMEHALFVRPLETFAALWPRVVEMGDTRPLRVTVIGAGTGGVEMAFAVRQRLPQAAVTLLCGDTLPAAHCTERLQRRLMDLLKQRNITVLQDRAIAIKSGFVQLGCGADLACDVPLLATGTLPPQWLADSGLALDEQGFIAVNTFQRSTSHNQIFAADDISTGTGPALVHNLAAAVAGESLKTHRLPATALHLVACGDRYAVGSWGRYSFQGRWVWWLKDRMDRRFLAQYQSSGQIEANLTSSPR
jgi:NADH dehydrogenase FAD-containing subunit